MSRKIVNTVSDKLVKVSESFTVYMYDNGFMFEVGGQDKKGDWVTAKIMVSNLEQLIALVKETAEMERNS